MKQTLQTFLFILLVYTFGVTAPAHAGEQTFTVAVVPQSASSKIFREWTPFLSRLEQLTGYRFKLLAYDAFADFEKEFSEGIPDLIFLNPYHLVVAKRLQDYQPLVRDSTPLAGILVVKKGGQIKVLADLNGKTIAFPSPNSLGASLYMRAILFEENHISFNPVYVGSHQNVYRHVLLGEADAGGGIKRTLNKESNALRSNLNILFKTPEIAPHPLAAHPRVKAEVRKKIIAAILAMGADSESSKLLAAIQIPRPVKADYQRDYAGLEKLRLDRYYINREQ